MSRLSKLIKQLKKNTLDGEYPCELVSYRITEDRSVTGTVCNAPHRLTEGEILSNDALVRIKKDAFVPSNCGMCALDSNQIFNETLKLLQ